jgi:enoyl-CoA hydratase/carnithine racemase
VRIKFLEATGIDRSRRAGRSVDGKGRRVSEKDRCERSAGRACDQARRDQEFGFPLDEGYKIEIEIARGVFSSEEAKEGPRAFIEKRKPNFKDK